jgi:hypothetical protein
MLVVALLWVSVRYQHVAGEHHGEAMWRTPTEAVEAATGQLQSLCFIVLEDKRLIVSHMWLTLIPIVPGFHSTQDSRVSVCSGPRGMTMTLTLCVGLPRLLLLSCALFCLAHTILAFIHDLSVQL